ncbi:MAG: alpha-ribazole phosphatase [Paraburkholderia sp.]|jgi:alpha-ribazole phosphatase|nr:alpha-ribazole phosphatase [Paraburkholderia sp.]
MDLVLIRHPAPAVEAGICYGRSDVPLAENARVSSDSLFARLAALGVPPPKALWTSPLRRCSSVAAWLARRCRCVATADARLQEMDFGAWERMRWDAIDRAAIDAWAADFVHARLHGGESVAQFAARVAGWFEAWRASCDAFAGGAALPAPPASSALSGLTGSSVFSDSPGSKASAASAASVASAASAASPISPTSPTSPTSTAVSASDRASANRAAYVVTHAGVIRVLISLALEVPLEEVQNWPLEMAAIVWLRYERTGRAWQLLRWNA